MCSHCLSQVQRHLDDLIFPKPSPALSQELINRPELFVDFLHACLVEQSPEQCLVLDAEASTPEEIASQLEGGCIFVCCLYCARIRQTTGYHSQDVGFVQLSFWCSVEQRHFTDVSTPGDASDTFKLGLADAIICGRWLHCFEKEWAHFSSRLR